LPSACLDLAVLFWGFAYFLGTVHEHANAGRIFELNFFGSIIPAAAFSEWITLVLLFLALAAFAIPKFGKGWTNIGLATGIVVFISVLGEGIARVKAAVFPTTHGFPTYSSVLWGQRYAKINREGFRDVEHNIVSDSGIRRLLIVGDSYAYGYGIKHIEDRFGELLAAILKERTGQCWEVINASRPGSHTLQHIEFLKHMLKYTPDVVILIYTFNDIEYLYPVTRLNDPMPSSNSIFDYFHFIRRLLYKNSYLFQEVYVRLRSIYFRLSSDNRNDLYKDSSLVSRHLEDLLRFVATARQPGAIVGVAPFDIAVTTTAKVRSRYQDFVNQAVAVDIPIWPLDEVFNGRQFAELIVNELDNHPNELADHLAATGVTERLLQELNIKADRKTRDLK
jgi:hypothetical protein